MLARREIQCVDDRGNIIKDTQVEVRREVAGQPLAAIYADRDGSVPLGNPFPVDAETGVGAFHAAGGSYRIRAFTTGGLERIQRYVGIGTASETDAVTGVVLEARTITAGGGLTGGGDLSEDRTIAMANMAQSTIKGRAAGTGTGAPADLSAAQATAILNPFVGDTGAGGTKGLVPAPGAGDAVRFLRGDGTFAAGAGLQLLDSGTVSNASTLDIVLTSFAAYRTLYFELVDFVPATDDVDLWVRFSTNGGSSYDAGSSDYRFSNEVIFSTSSPQVQQSAGAAQIQIAGGSSGTAHIGNQASEGISLGAWLRGFGNGAMKTKITAVGEYYGAGNFSASFRAGGHRNAAQGTNAVRWMFSSGNIDSGNWALYGYA